jgi:bilirubin oxidase
MKNPPPAVLLLAFSSLAASTLTASPVIALTSPLTGAPYTVSTISVTGTSSAPGGSISSVMVNNVAAVSGDGFATWTASIPLGFGTNAVTATATDNTGTSAAATLTVTTSAAPAYNPLIIPDTLTGPTFNLSLNQRSKQFQSGAATTTYSYNDMLFWGPTLIMNKDEWVQIHLKNNLIDTTTTHWHGFHIPAIMDGGPHQTIPGGTTWSPSFKVDNNAGTYWYHPHLHEKAQEQVTRGGGGFIIIRDPQEAALNLPRTYGVDDIPLALTSRRFLTTAGNVNQFAVTNSAYGDYLMVNGTLKPQISLPAQYVRLRVLNADIERSFNVGFSDNRTFWVIATDGGLVNAPIAVTRVDLGVGERAEILVNLGGATVGSTLDLKAYNSGQARDYPGGEPDTSGPFGSLLNNTTIQLLRINVAAATANPITTRPTTLKSNPYWTAADVTNPVTRTIRITGGIPNSATPLFTFDNIGYSSSVINQNLKYNAVEKWTIVNNSGFSHSFHIHDVQFNLLSRTGGNNSGLKAAEAGWKDTFFIGQNASVSFLAKFDSFASNNNPFMYHCHFANHEDEGLMGQFLVKNNAIEDLGIASFARTGNNSQISLVFKSTPGTTYTLQYSPNMLTGSWTDIGSVTSDGSSAAFTETDPVRLAQARGFYRVTIPVIP